MVYCDVMCRVCVCVCVLVSACACVCLYVCLCVCVCMYVCNVFVNDGKGAAGSNSGCTSLYCGKAVFWSERKWWRWKRKKKRWSENWGLGLEESCCCYAALPRRLLTKFWCRYQCFRFGSTAKH